MAKRPERKIVRPEDLKVPPRPQCPWDDETAFKLAQRSQSEGHRVLWFKCMQCALEYQVRTWRDGEDAKKHFQFCPECGSKGSSYCLRIDHELGPIFQALHPPEADEPGVG